MEYQGPLEIIKIAVVGPESTGKSTMATFLAAHYNTVWVPEYAREYCEKLTSPPTWQDEINMFHGQLALERKILPDANKLLICDTTFLTVKVWSEHTFGNAPQEVLNELPHRPYDFYLLLNIDLPWQDDPLRDFPQLREHFMTVWRRELEELQATYVIIEGVGPERNQRAVAAVDNYLKQASFRG
ncbi:MAG TPA: ATP-binding protein [Mucilaginibacter sp.]|nr:ATP-binding protein [Mucilaginibacter sp.]